MSSPKATLEDWIAERDELAKQLEATPSSGATHQNFVDTTGQSIANLKARIAELNDLIANLGVRRN